MSITIKARIDTLARQELDCCVPAVMKNHEGKTVIVIRGNREALCFNHDGSITYGDADYFGPQHGFVFVREMQPTDSLTIKGDE